VPRIVSSVIETFFFDQPSSVGKRSFSAHMLTRYTTSQ
jgi:hypothetical protein